jgi:peptidoglycan/LPS O-acetylase OafA/YrhL
MNRQFPALSGLAILLIVINHTIEMGTNVPVEHGFAPLEGSVRLVLGIIQGLGVFAVPTFLFISGTFVTYAARGEPPRLTGKFLLRSLGHIWWPYLIWSVVFYGVVLLQFGERYTPFGYLKNLLVGYPYHFVPLLLLFYVLSPLLIRLGRGRALWLLLPIGVYQLILMGVVKASLFPELRPFIVPPGLGRTLADWAVFFPLGLVYGLNMSSMAPRLRKWKHTLAAATILFFVLGVLHYNRILSLPPAGVLAALAFVLLLPSLDRGAIPFVARLEEVGKHSYGLYLTHLLVLNLSLLAIGVVAPVLFGFQVPLLLPLFLVALFVPLLLMRGPARRLLGRGYRYLLG